jgi:hypothetical protein
MSKGFTSSAAFWRALFVLFVTGFRVLKLNRNSVASLRSGVQLSACVCGQHFETHLLEDSSGSLSRVL